jgi:hypothetical protein
MELNQCSQLRGADLMEHAHGNRHWSPETLISMAHITHRDISTNMHWMISQPFRVAVVARLWLAIANLWFCQRIFLFQSYDLNSGHSGSKARTLIALLTNQQKWKQKSRWNSVHTLETFLALLGSDLGAYFILAFILSTVKLSILLFSFFS